LLLIRPNNYVSLNSRMLPPRFMSCAVKMVIVHFDLSVCNCNSEELIS